MDRLKAEEIARQLAAEEAEKARLQALEDERIRKEEEIKRIEREREADERRK